MEEFNNISSPEELLEFMDCISYGFVSKTGKKYYDNDLEGWNNWFEECCVQNGEDVLKSRVGTCWDQVELERLWFDKNNYKFKTIFSWFEHGRNDDMPTHTFLIYESNNKYYWFEHSFEMYKGIYEFDSEEDAIEYVKDKQFEYALMNNECAKENDRDYLVCYEYNKPMDHLNVKDYLEYVTSRKPKNTRRK